MNLKKNPEATKQRAVKASRSQPRKDGVSPVTASHVAMESKGQGGTWQDTVRDHGDQQTRFPLRKQNQNLMEKVPPAPGWGPSPCLPLATVTALNLTTAHLLFHPVRNGVFSAFCSLSSPTENWEGLGRRQVRVFLL